MCQETNWIGPCVAHESHLKRELALKLKQTMTPAERTLWYKLRDNRLQGFHFRRQQVILGFITDFYCHEARLAIEVDGDVHAKQHQYDFERDNVLESNGINVLRISNEDVDKRLGQAIARIESILAERCGLI
jgi:very-short-patch-repair endonuclease